MHKYFIYSLLLLFSSSTNAGLKALTHHSRANCFTINETISWDARKRHRLAIISEHKSLHTNKAHIDYSEDDDKTSMNGSYTYRAAVVHFNEAPLDNKVWRVHGFHYIVSWQSPGWTWEKVAEEIVTDCSKYDGWWDADHPERKSL